MKENLYAYGTKSQVIEVCAFTKEFSIKSKVTIIPHYAINQGENANDEVVNTNAGNSSLNQNNPESLVNSINCILYSEILY